MEEIMEKKIIAEGKTKIPKIKGDKRGKTKPPTGGKTKPPQNKKK